MGDIRALTGLSGLTPMMERTTRAFWQEIWEAIDKASEAGMTTGQIVGSLEVAKAGVIRDHFDDNDE